MPISIRSKLTSIYNISLSTLLPDGVRVKVPAGSLLNCVSCAQVSLDRERDTSLKTQSEGEREKKSVRLPFLSLTPLLLVILLY
jgi:hypothetical protein